jgi:hypothetical protein
MILMAIDTHPRMVEAGRLLFATCVDPTIKLATPLRAMEILTVIDIAVERTE